MKSYTQGIPMSKPVNLGTNKPKMSKVAVQTGKNQGTMTKPLAKSR